MTEDTDTGRPVATMPGPPSASAKPAVEVVDLRRHWHPTGRSHATFPHLHLYTVRPDGHFVTPRQTLESAVQWCIEMGAEPRNPQWHSVLAESEGIHQLYRSLVGGPAIATSGSVTSALTAPMQNVGGQPRVHPAFP